MMTKYGTMDTCAMSSPVASPMPYSAHQKRECIRLTERTASPDPPIGKAGARSARLAGQLLLFVGVCRCVAGECVWGGWCERRWRGQLAYVEADYLAA